MPATNFTGYVGAVWGTCYSALQYLLANLDGSPSVNVTIAELVLDTLLSGAHAIAANDIATAWHTDFCYLQEIDALPIGAAPADAAVFSARLDAYATAQPAIAALVPQPPFLPASALASGSALIPPTNLLNFFMTFDYETPPSGLTAANLVAQAQAIAVSLGDVAVDLMTYQGNFVTQLYDAAVREAAAASAAAQMLGSFTSGPFAAASALTWNTVVTLPAMLRVAATINSAPATFGSQQSAVVRNALLTLAAQVETYLLTLRATATQQVSTATLRNGESLMDFAARTLGNFELWQQVAAVNGLQPPYVGPAAAPGIAAWGSSLVLPTPGVQPSAVGAAPSYAANFLGTDTYVGPINGQMPAWTGDYQLITGYSNLRWALGRRIQTTLGGLIYHSTYGCRIPPEVGAVQDNQTAGNIAAYGQGALLSDPRVQSVPSAAAALVQQGVEFSATVQPAGFGSATINVNEVIGPAP